MDNILPILTIEIVSIITPISKKGIVTCSSNKDIVISTAIKSISSIPTSEGVIAKVTYTLNGYNLSFWKNGYNL